VPLHLESVDSGLTSNLEVIDSSSFRIGKANPLERRNFMLQVS